MRRKDSLNPPEQDPIRALQNQLEEMRSQMIILQNRIATLEAAIGTGEVRSQPDETKSAGEPTAFRFKGLALTPGGFLNSTALVRTRNESADVATSYSATPLEGSSNANLSELLLHGDDDQIVPIADSALLSAKIVKNATLKVYRGAPHGMPATFKDHINADLLAFFCDSGQAVA